MFWKRSEHAYGRTEAATTPYQRAGQVWDDRIGSARVQAKNWRLMAVGCLATTAVFGLALVWQSTQGTIVPYVVEVDRLGAARGCPHAVLDDDRRFRSAIVSVLP